MSDITLRERKKRRNQLLKVNSPKLPTKYMEDKSLSFTYKQGWTQFFGVIDNDSQTGRLIKFKPRYLPQYDKLSFQRRELLVIPRDKATLYIEGFKRMFSAMRIPGHTQFITLYEFDIKHKGLPYTISFRVTPAHGEVAFKIPDSDIVVNRLKFKFSDAPVTSYCILSFLADLQQGILYNEYYYDALSQD